MSNLKVWIYAVPAWKQETAEGRFFPRTNTNGKKEKGGGKREVPATSQQTSALLHCTWDFWCRW